MKGTRECRVDGWYCRDGGCFGSVGVELSLSIADALMDSRESRLGPSNEIRGS